MKRSEINSVIKDAEKFFKERGFFLPPFASWTPNDWAVKGREADEIRKKALGWDLTDFGLCEFDRTGILLFTIRNGAIYNPGEIKQYAEKAMILNDGQVCPWHFHWKKVEDIINRGGANLIVDLAWATDNESGLSDRSVRVSIDGVEREVAAKSSIALTPGESVTLPPKLYHRFYAKPGAGRAFIGEVSMTNDDEKDNRFLEPIKRFSKIEEDEPPYRYLCNEYPPAKK